MGTGCLKPNVSTLVGSLYPQGDARRDAGFSIFYMGINLGATLGPLIAGYLAQNVNWHIGFACAGVGMTFGLIQYVVGRERLQHGIARLTPANEHQRVPASAEATAGAAPPDKKEEWKRIAAIFFFFAAVIFWGAYEQAGRIDAESVRGPLTRLGCSDSGSLVVVPIQCSRSSSSSSRPYSDGCGCGSGGTSRPLPASSRSDSCSWASRSPC
jgi:dipeptide/tripeptide permease